MVLSLRGGRAGNKWGSSGICFGAITIFDYNNDLDNGISSDISKFADDSKIDRIIRSEFDVKDLQGDDWVVRWHMEFNHEKCRVINIGRENPHNRFNISKVIRNRSECERFWVYRSDLHPRKQCIEVRNRANRVLGFIARSVKSRSAEAILKLYLALVRPHLSYVVLFWSPYYKMNVGLLESVQRRMIKMIEGICNSSYERRLNLLKLHSLERRRVREDLIEVFKWVKSFNKGDVEKVLTVSSQDRT